MGWGSGALAVVCLAVGLMHLVRLAVVRRDVLGEASHVTMALGMAAMTSPLGNPVPVPVWTAAFVLIAAWFGALALRSGGFAADRGHHVVCCAAMLFMLVSEHGNAAPAGGHMAHMGGAAAGPAVALASMAAIAFTGYFGWHILRCADRCRRTGPAGPVPGGGAQAPGAAALRPTWSVRAPQTAAAGHLVLAASMAAALLTMV